jgi:hypothetical protein
VVLGVHLCQLILKRDRSCASLVHICLHLPTSCVLLSAREPLAFCMRVSWACVPVVSCASALLMLTSHLPTSSWLHTRDTFALSSCMLHCVCFRCGVAVVNCSQRCCSALAGMGQVQGAVSPRQPIAWHAFPDPTMNLRLFDAGVPAIVSSFECVSAHVMPVG